MTQYTKVCLWLLAVGVVSVMFGVVWLASHPAPKPRTVLDVAMAMPANGGALDEEVARRMLDDRDRETWRDRAIAGAIALLGVCVALGGAVLLAWRRFGGQKVILAAGVLVFILVGLDGVAQLDRLPGGVLAPTYLWAAVAKTLILWTCVAVATGVGLRIVRKSPQ